MINNLHNLNKFVNSGKYLNAYDFVNKDYTMTFIMDAKGTGKSHTFLHMCIDKIEQDENFVWIRNTKNEFVSSQVHASFNKAFADRGLLEKYVATESGVYKIVKINEKREQRILVGLFAYASNFLANASQNALGKCKLIVWDEFINPDFNKPDLFTLALKAFDTYKRKNIAHVFLLGNKHTTSNDMLEGAGVEFDWTSKKNQVYFDKDSSVQAFYIGKHIVRDNQASVEQINKWARYSESGKSFYSGNASVVPNTNVINWSRNNIASMFHPLWKFTLNNQEFCLGKLDNGCFYIKAIFRKDEFEDTKGWFCFFPADKTDYNVYLHPLRDINHIKVILNAYNNGILYYDWYNTQEVTKQILRFLNIISAPDKNTI